MKKHVYIMIKSKIIAVLWIFRKIGAIQTTKIFFEILIKKPKEHLVKFNFKGKDVKIFIMGVRTDLAMLTEIFCFESYEIKKDLDPKLIVDGGANKGLASIYFGVKYKNPRIHCYEPNNDLIEILKRNLEINNVDFVVYDKALSYKEGVAFLDKNRNHQYSKLTNLDTGTKVEKVCLNTYSNQKIDILKLDVEGSEEKIIEYLENPNIDVIIQEIHYDRVNIINILSMLKTFGYSIERPYLQYSYLNPTKKYPILLAIKR